MRPAPEGGPIRAGFRHPLRDRTSYTHAVSGTLEARYRPAGIRTILVGDMAVPRKARRTARWAASASLAVAVALLLSACTGSGYQYLKTSRDGTGTYFKVPDGWKVYDEREFIKTRNLSPARSQVLRDTSWTVAFDASSKPSLKHYDELVTSKPFGLARVRELDPDEHNQFSLEAMRNIVVPVDTLAQQGAQVEVLRVDEFSRAGGFRGLRFAFNVQPPDSQEFVTFDQVSIVDADTKELHLLFISCSAKCYQREKGTINTVMDSWTVKER
jgi:hypothetical protein